MNSHLALRIAIVGMALIVAGVAVLNLLSKSAGH
jgi:multidrug transporter EmrE-like cation transporter